MELSGTASKGDPRNAASTMIHWANLQESPVLSLDTPSGIDLTSGTIYNPHIEADATLTLALPKVGLFKEKVLIPRGELYLGDISVPPELYTKPGLELEIQPDLFLENDILRLD